MKTRLWNTGATALFCVPVLILSLSASAHEPEKHAKNAEAPDCAAMQHTNPDEMDENDPVMQAMMEQCKSDMQAMNDHSESSEDTGHHGADAQAEPAAPHGH